MEHGFYELMYQCVSPLKSEGCSRRLTRTKCHSQPVCDELSAERSVVQSQ